MKWTPLLVICCIGAITCIPLPPDPLPSVDLDDYTVLYNGPSGSHYQSGEPGKFVKGIYTFLDSNGRKQQVTYEADARGYRVKTNTKSKDKIQPPATGTEITISDVRRNDQIFTAEEKNEETRTVQSVSGITEEPIAQPVTPPHPVPELLLQPPPAPIRQVKPNDEPERALNGASALTIGQQDPLGPTPQGTIKFKDARSLQSSNELGYFVGYPFLPGNYVYAL